MMKCVVFVLALISLVGCGGGTSPSSRVSTIGILGGSQGNAGVNYPFYLIVQFSDLHSETSCTSAGNPPLCTITSGVTWTSSNTQVATINASGVLTTLRLGNTTITATYAGKTVSKAFSVI